MSMHTWFECKIRYEKLMENGMNKKVTEPYLVDALSFTEAEARIIEEMTPFITGEFTVSDIKRANYSELFPSEEEAADRWFKCKLIFITLDEKSGAEKKTSTQVLVQAADLRDAVKKLDEGMRESKDQVQVIGNFNSESTYLPIGTSEPQSILQTCGRGYYVVAVLGAGQEPTNHALRDIAALSGEFEKWGRKMVLLFPSEEQYKKFRPSEFPGLPSTITYGIDVDGAIQKQIAESMKLPNSTILPMFIIGDTFNRVVFVSQGYTIGLGEQLMKVIHGL